MMTFTASVKATVVALLAALAVLTPFAAAHAGPPAGTAYPYIGSDREGVVGVSIGGTSDSPEHDDPDGIHTFLFPVYTKEGAAPDLFAYCIEYAVDSRTSAEATTTGWEKFPGTNRFTDENVQRQVGWAIQNSFPEVSVEELAAKAGAEGLTAREAIGATQAAIWHFTDGFTLKPQGTSGDYERVSAAFNYLTGKANVGLPRPGAAPQLKLNAAQDSAVTAGGRVGPIRVQTNQKSVSVSVDTDYPIVDAQGQKIDLTAVKNGDELYVDVPADAEAGSAQFTASASSRDWTGNLLLVEGRKPNTRSQTVIIVNEKKTDTADAATVNWNAAEQPVPSDTPSETPSETPSGTPSETPSAEPSETPSEVPSESPSETPSETPSATPTETPSAEPSATPSEVPSESPSATPSATVSESVPAAPSETASEAPKAQQTQTPNASTGSRHDDGARSLPRTGATVLASLGLATLLLAGGIAAVWLARRRSA